MNNTTVKLNDKFVACWGYDQTQYSVYNVVEAKGKFVSVEGLNSYSHIDENDLATGSQVKIYSYTPWDELGYVERDDLTKRHFDRWSYNHHAAKEALDAASVHTIVKVQRIDGERWTYIWTLSNGHIIRSDENYKLNRHVEIVKGLKRCLVQISKYDGKPRIKIDGVVTPHLDPGYNQHKQRYSEQNEYTTYNGR